MNVEGAHVPANAPRETARSARVGASRVFIEYLFLFESLLISSVKKYIPLQSLSRAVLESAGVSRPLRSRTRGQARRSDRLAGHAVPRGAVGGPAVLHSRLAGHRAFPDRARDNARDAGGLLRLSD